MATINITLKADLSRNDKIWASQIASTMQQQMTYPNRVVFWSWGACKYTFGINQQGEPFLRFKVNGMKFKGYVWVVYDFSDTYKISFVSTHGNVKKEITNVYADQLQEIIDNFVERINDYEF